jgi:hypothetical protein
MHRDLEYDTSSSSDEDLPKTPSLCQISSQNNEFTISAKSTTDYAIRLEQGSFVFKRINSNVVLQFNRMFLWRLLNSSHLNKNEDADLFRIRDFITRIKDHVILISVTDGIIKFNFNGQEKYIPMENAKDLNDDFDQLYYTAMRKYKTEEFLDKILTTSIRLLNLIRVQY